MSTPTLRKILILLFLIMVGLNAYRMWKVSFVGPGADFPAYLAGAQGMLHGTNPYLPTAVPPYNTLQNFRPFIYPLFIAWLWIPFALLPPIVASFAWYALSVVILMRVLYVLARLLDINTERQRWLFYGILTLLFVSVIQIDAMYGQMNLFVLLLLLIGVEYLGKSPVKSGFGFGAAISAKFMPIVLLPVIALKNIRVSIISVLAILLLCIAVPFAIAGSKIFDYYQYWFHNTISTDLGEANNYGYTSFDLAGVLAQLTGMDHPTTFVRIICGLFLLAFPLILIRHGSFLPAFFLAFMLLPLTGSRSEAPHLIVLMPAVGLILADLLKRKARAWEWGGLIVLQLAILWGYNQAVPFDTVGLLILFGIVFRIGIRESSEYERIKIKTP